jgi:transposase-like protein
MSQNRVFNSEEVARLKNLIEEGAQVHTEIDALKEGLKDTVASIAEELDVKPATLNKAIRVAYKQSMDDEREKFDELENILESINNRTGS